eukprot:1156909-Rhodomonas_salina.3
MAISLSRTSATVISQHRISTKRAGRQRQHVTEHVIHPVIHASALDADGIHSLVQTHLHTSVLVSNASRSIRALQQYQRV